MAKLIDRQKLPPGGWVVLQSHEPTRYRYPTFYEALVAIGKWKKKHGIKMSAKMRKELKRFYHAKTR